jgi:hypothetical protein
MRVRERYAWWVIGFLWMGIFWYNLVELALDPWALLFMPLWRLLFYTALPMLGGNLCFWKAAN